MDRVKGVRDGDTIDTGRHTLRFLETPHVHHWDSMMVFEESTAACSHPTSTSSPATSRRS